MRYRHILITVLLLALWQSPCLSQQQVRDIAEGTKVAANFTNLTASIPNTATTVTLVYPANNITVVNGSSTTSLYVSFDGTSANTSTHGFLILPDAAYSYRGDPVVSFSIIGSAASGNYSVMAH